MYTTDESLIEFVSTVTACDDVTTVQLVLLKVEIVKHIRLGIVFRVRQTPYYVIALRHRHRHHPYHEPQTKALNIGHRRGNEQLAILAD